MSLSLSEYEEAQKQVNKILKAEKKKMKFFNFHSCLDCAYCKTSLFGCFCEKMFDKLQNFDEKIALAYSAVNDKSSCGEFKTR